VNPRGANGPLGVKEETPMLIAQKNKKKIGIVIM
jgi:hypothetical protein